MLIDNHYFSTKAIFVSAGFSEHEAQLVAYANQYSDDSTPHKGIKINGIELLYPEMLNDNKEFEPICTAHKGIGLLHSLEKNVQRKVYAPFHYPHCMEYKEQYPFIYIVKENSGPIKTYIKNLIQKIKSYEPETKERERYLIALGIAIHTLQDSFSHEFFSARWNDENSIELIACKDEKGKWEKFNILERKANGVIPNIGHAEARNLPDISNLVWKFKNIQTKKIITRNNPEIFLRAAKQVFSIASTIMNKSYSLSEKEWVNKGLKGKIPYLFSFDNDNMDELIKQWKKTFPAINFEYNEYAWIKSALHGKTYDFKHYRTSKDYKTLSYEFSGDSKWFDFHIAAKNQRDFMMSKMDISLL